MLFRILLIAIILFAKPCFAVLEIDITRGNADPMPVALPYLGSESSADQKYGKDIMNIVEADLQRSGLFKSINRRAFLQEIKGVETVPDFSSWKQINASALVTGSVDSINRSNIKTSFRLWDVYAQQQLTGKIYNTLSSNWRRVGHLIADEVYTNITGEKGYFDTRIVYISETGDPRKKVKRLAIMDQDGANHKFLTDGRNLVLTPRFSPNMQRVIYLSYVNDTPRVHMRDIETGKDWVVGKFPGMSFAPQFAPDGRSVIMSVSLNGNSEIYTYNLSTRKKRRLTNNGAIDVSPSYSPDGKNIVFNSDRGGSQQLYVMDQNGNNVERISFGKGRYGSPIWSPRGDLIAFTKMHKGLFYIGVMRPDGSGERLLTESYLDESPTWSPNGRVIIFTRQTAARSKSRPGKSFLYSIDLTGYNERRVATPLEASDPAWSPLMSMK